MWFKFESVSLPGMLNGESSFSQDLSLSCTLSLADEEEAFREKSSSLPFPASTLMVSLLGDCAAVNHWFLIERSAGSGKGTVRYDLKVVGGFWAAKGPHQSLSGYVLRLTSQLFVGSSTVDT